MRVAVVLPTLPKEALHREALDRVLAALPGLGVEVEGFAERPRDRDGDDPFPVFHYLRLAGRHATAPFDTGLYLLGRDMRIYEPPYLAMHRFPAAVWVLDPVVHHLVIGGVAAWGRWDEYRDMLEAEFGAETGADVAQTVASGWGVSSMYRSRDPLVARVARQPAACGATPAIARSLESAGAPASVVRVPAPVADADAGRPRPARRAPRILMLRPNYSWPEPAFRGLARVVAGSPDVEISIAAPEVVRAAGMRFPAGGESLRERVGWVDAGDWAALRAAVDDADIVLHLLDDPTVGERVLLERAAAAGAVVMMLRCPGTDGFPDDAVVRIEPGRAQGASLAAMLEAILASPDLAGALGRRAASSIAGGPTADESAAALVPVLERAAAAGFSERVLTRPIWGALRSNVASRVVPRGAALALERQILERVDRAAPAGYRSLAG